jgi:hypothetical protein
MDVLAGEALDPRGDRLGRGGGPTGEDLTGLGVERVEGDLAAAHVEARVDDAHERPPLAPETDCERESPAERTEVPQFMPSMESASG